MTRARVGSVVALVVLTGAPLVHAQSAPRRIELQICGPRLRTGGLESKLRELLGRVGIVGDFTVAPSLDQEALLAEAGTPAQPGLLGRVAIDLTHDAPVIYVADRHDAVLVRRLDVPSDTEMGRETIAHVVQDAVDSLQVGAPVGFVPPTPPQPIPPEAPPAAPRPRARARPALTLGIGYLGGTGPTTDRSHGALLWLGLAQNLERIVPSVFLAVVFRAPRTVTAPGLELRLDELDLRLAAAWERALSNRLSTAIVAGLGVDFVRSDVPRNTGGFVWTRGGHSDVQPVAYLGAALAWPLAKGLAIVLAGGVDLDPHPLHFQVVGPSGPETVLQAWPVRPTVSLSLLGSHPL